MSQLVIAVDEAGFGCWWWCPAPATATLTLATPTPLWGTRGVECDNFERLPAPPPVSSDHVYPWWTLRWEWGNPSSYKLWILLAALKFLMQRSISLSHRTQRLSTKGIDLHYNFDIIEKAKKGFSKNYKNQMSQLKSA